MTIAPRSRAASRTGTAAFLRRAITDQASLGAIAPTLPLLARRLAGLVPPTRGLRVLELGAGTGAVSAAIGPQLAPGALHIAVERDPELLATLGHRAPWALRMTGDAADLSSHLAAVGTTEVDVVISALPWGYFGPATQRRILGEICSVLVPGGLFATIVCRPARLNARSRAFHALAEASFKEVEATRTTWLNIPPARLLVCRGPRRDVFDDA